MASSDASSSSPIRAGVRSDASIFGEYIHEQNEGRKNTHYVPLPATVSLPANLAAAAPSHIAVPVTKSISPKQQGLVSRIMTWAVKNFSKDKPLIWELAGEHVKRAPENIELARNLTIPKSESGLLSLGEALFTTDAEIAKNPRSKAVVAQRAYASELHKNVDPLLLPLGKNQWEIHAYGCVKIHAYGDVKEGMVRGTVIPTSVILGGKGDNHLTNCYVVSPEGPEKTVIRSGVINSAVKADEFLTIISSVRDKIIGQKNAPVKVRVCSHQLNSPEGEAKLINRQHEELTKLNSWMEENNFGQIAHINSPSNSLYSWSKRLKKVPLIGLLTDKILPGEKKSREQNLEGWAHYLEWLGEDISQLKECQLGTPLGSVLWNFASRTGPDSSITTLRKQVEELVRTPSSQEDFSLPKEALNKAFILASKARKHNTDYYLPEDPKVKLKEARKELRDHLLSQYDHLMVLENTLNNGPSLKDNQPLKDLQIKVRLMRQILSGQLEVKGVKHLGRGREEMSIALLNQKLGLIEAINCKSGLDRTGFRHGMSLALRQLADEIGFEATMDMVENWGARTSKINKIIATVGLEGFHIWMAGLSPEENRKMAHVIKFRELVLQNLIKIGQPITAISTGITGFKWNSGLQENLVPLNFLPSHVEKNKEAIQIVNYDSKGKVRGLSRMGQRLMTKLSSVRGT